MINITDEVNLTTEIAAILKEVPTKYFHDVIENKDYRFVLYKFIKEDAKGQLNYLSEKIIYPIPQVKLLDAKLASKLLQFIRDLLTKSILELKKNNAYYVRQYIELMRYRNYKKYLKLNSMSNCQSNRKLYFSRLKDFLDDNEEFCAIFVPNFIGYTSYEIKKLEEFEKFCNKMFSYLDQINFKLTKIFDYDAFARKYRLKLLDEISKNILVCPYCNISTALTTETKSEWDFDHFFGKATYPLFACSFGNFVPSCKNCNQTYKVVDQSEILNPREDGFSPEVTFRFIQKKIMTISEMEDLIDDRDSVEKYFCLDLQKNTDISMHDNKVKKILNSIDLLCLKKRYNNYPQLARAVEFITEIHYYYNTPLLEEYKMLVPNTYRKLLKCKNRQRAEKRCLLQDLFRMKLDILTRYYESDDDSDRVM